MLAYQTAIIPLVLALVLGGIIGLERERGERAAGCAPTRWWRWGPRW